MGTNDRVRLGMVGGGEGAFIGAVHRIAARLDDAYVLVCGALSSEPERAQASAAVIGLDPARSYASYTEMFVAERNRSDGMEVVAIVTPNHLHYPVARAALQAGFHVICDKPLVTSVAEADELVRLAADADRIFAITYNYSGYPMVRQARAMVARGDIGALRVVQVEYAQEWLAGPLEATGQKQAEWGTIHCVLGRAVRSAISAVMRSTWPALSPVACPSRFWRISRHSLPDGVSMTTRTYCCASPLARAACYGRVRWRMGMRTRCGCACMARREGSNGRRKNQIVCGSCHQTAEADADARRTEVPS